MASDTINVHRLKGRDTLNLGQRHYMTSGGEADLYKMGNLVYKVYHTARPAEYVQKLTWLLDHPTKNTSTIEDILMDSRGQVMGYSMPYIKGATLGEMFPTSWQQRNRWTSKDTLAVVKKMENVLHDIHATGCLIVDCNDGNWVIDGKEPFVLDSDSWQLPQYKATAIVPSIQDPTVLKNFNQGSDWFSWAVITFMLWTGLHPYKGMHTQYPKNSLDKRMKDGVSVLDSAVKVPKVFRGLDAIPPALLDWYRAIFEHKTRSSPPPKWWTLSSSRSTKSTTVTSFDPVSVLSGLTIEPLGFVNGVVNVIDQEWLMLNDNTIVHWSDPKTVLASFTTGSTWHKGHYVSLKEAYTGMQSATLWSSSGRLFVRVEEQQLGLIELTNLHGKWMVKQSWPCLVNACQWFDRMFIQRVLGSTFVNSVSPDGGMHSIRTPWLDKLQVHSGVSLDPDNHWIVASAKGTTDYVLFYFDSSGAILYQSCTQGTALQYVALPTGVGLVAASDKWFLSKGKIRKQWDIAGWSEHYLLGLNGSRVQAVMNGKHVALTLGP